MNDFTKTELELIFHAVYEFAISDDKHINDSDFKDLQALTDDEIDDITIAIRNKIKRIINKR